MTEDLSALVIGCGSIGSKHARNLRELGVDIVVFDTDWSRRDTLAEEVSATSSDSMDSALEQCPDIAIVATPSDAHIKPAQRAARAGCHLFVEKPLSNDETGIQELLCVARDRDLVTMVGSNFRFHPAITSIKEMIDRAEIGGIISARIEGGSYLPDWHPDEDYRNLYSAKKGIGGALLDYIHELNYARWLFGEVKTVTAMLGCESSLEIETEDTAALIARLIDGTIVEFHLDYVQRAYSRSCHIVGEEGTLRWEWAQSSVERYDPESDSWITEASWDEEWDPDQMYMNELEHFLSCVSAGQETRSTLREGYRDLKVALAAKESALSGEHVYL